MIKMENSFYLQENQSLMKISGNCYHLQAKVFISRSLMRSYKSKAIKEIK
jgi:hypothetical protein